MEKKDAQSQKSKEKSREKRLANLVKFQPGKSGNPKGKKKGQRDYATIYRAALIQLGKANGKAPEKIEEELLAMGTTLAAKGDYRFYKDMLDRLHGTPAQRIDHTSGGEAITGFNYVSPEEKK